MDVYLIPLPASRYELYCEPSGEAAADAGAPPTGPVERTLERMRRALERLDAPEAAAAPAPRTWRARARQRAMRWAAARVAEQRLLWRLRKVRAARIGFPDDLTPADAAAIVRGLLGRDAARHRRWMLVHLAALVPAVVLLGPIFLIIPGIANLPAVYFAFRAFGHFLSMQGARQGLTSVAWTYAPSDALTAMRALDGLGRAERAQRVDDLAARLGLAHVASFFRRTAL